MNCSLYPDLLTSGKSNLYSKAKERPYEWISHCLLFESNNLHKSANTSTIKLLKSTEINNILDFKILEIIPRAHFLLK